MFEDDEICPICGEECWNNDDGGHLLGVFDHDWVEGEYGIQGGELYGISEISEFFERVFEDAASSLRRSEDPRRAKYSWLGEHRIHLMPLINSLASTSLPKAEVLSSVEDYGNSYGAILQHVENLADTLHETLKDLIDHTQSSEIESTNLTFDSMPGHSYNSGYWWCSHARDSAQALRRFLKTKLDAPSS